MTADELTDQLAKVYTDRQITHSFLVKRGGDYAILSFTSDELMEVVDMLDLLARDPSSENLARLATFWARFSADLRSTMEIPAPERDIRPDVERMIVYTPRIA